MGADSRRAPRVNSGSNPGRSTAMLSQYWKGKKGSALAGYYGLGEFNEDGGASPLSPHSVSGGCMAIKTHVGTRRRHFNKHICTSSHCGSLVGL